MGRTEAEICYYNGANIAGQSSPVTTGTVGVGVGLPQYFPLTLHPAAWYTGALDEVNISPAFPQSLIIPGKKAHYHGPAETQNTITLHNQSDEISPLNIYQGCADFLLTINEIKLVKIHFSSISVYYTANIIII